MRFYLGCARLLQRQLHSVRYTMVAVGGAVLTFSHDRIRHSSGP